MDKVRYRVSDIEEKGLRGSFPLIEGRDRYISEWSKTEW